MTESDRQTEDRIFDSAMEVFLEKGMDGARMQDIANHAGINKSLLHYYYRSKDRLFSAVFEKIATNLFAKFAPVFDVNKSLEDKIRFFFDEHIGFLQKNRRLPGFLLNEINRNPARLRNFISEIDFERVWTMLYTQHSDDLKKYNITREKLPQLMTTIVSMSVFPFAARGILEEIFEQMDMNFDDFIEERKKFAADFVITALKNMNQ
ncbi:MAG: TetR/AcrR family transcriptional regulator [Bacteroidales bacterium]|nr:TetR/AcrR family transcriptional regulator [Bacteroidales bacterium]